MPCLCPIHSSYHAACKRCVRAQKRTKGSRRRKVARSKLPEGVSAKMLAWASAKAEQENVSVRAVIKQALEQPVTLPVRTFKAPPIPRRRPPGSTSVNAPPIGAEMECWGFACHANGRKYMVEQNQAFAKKMKAEGYVERVVGPDE